MQAHEPEDLIREFITAFNDGDLDGIVRDLYEEDVVSVPGPGPAVESGRDAVVRGLEPVLATGGKMSLASVVAIRNGDLALTHTKVRLTLSGQEPMERPVGSAEIARRQADGTWRYVVDNSLGSAILDAMESSSSSLSSSSSSSSSS
jgi:uncharacterized protein (TIGR02246 family)